MILSNQLTSKNLKEREREKESRRRETEQTEKDREEIQTDRQTDRTDAEKKKEGERVLRIPSFKIFTKYIDLFPPQTIL